jgi:hypothetical protein
MLIDPPRSMPYVMPMTAAVAPAFTRRYPEAAAIFDNLHSMHDVISDVLANGNVPRSRKRAEILLAARRYRDDTTEVMTQEGWIAMATQMGIENQGGPVVGALTALPVPTVELGAVVRHDAAAADPHAGHAMPAAAPDSVIRLAERISRAAADSAARDALVGALFRLLADSAVQRGLSADSTLRRVLQDLVPHIPAEHRGHFEMMLRPPPPMRETRSWE